MVSQSLTTAQSSTNHHKEQKRNGLKTSAKHSGLIFIHQKKKKKEEVQRAAGSPSWALEAPGEPGSVQAREQGLALQALWGLLISISQVRWLVWLRLLQHLLWSVRMQEASQNSGNTGSQSCSRHQWAWSTGWPLPQNTAILLRGDFLHLSTHHHHHHQS